MARTPTLKPYWEVRYRKRRSKKDEWFVLVYSSELMARANYQLIQKMRDVDEVQFIPIEKFI